MTTETRIGIVAGLIIVVAASVYFFYGSERDGDAVLVGTPTRVTVPPKIPVSTEKKTTPPPRYSKTTRGVPLNSNPQADRLAQGRPPARNVPPSVQTPRPVAGALPTAKQPDSPIALRTAPSNELVEATWDNLLNRQKAAAEQAKTANATGPVVAPPISRSDFPSQTGTNPTLRGSPSVAIKAPAPTSVEPPRPTPVRSADSTATAAARKYAIAAGDTLSQIAKKFYGDETRSRDILAANPQIKSARNLKIGDVITIPEPKGEIRTVTETTLEPSNIRSTAATLPPGAARSGKTYTVQGGDTLYSIARQQCGASSRWEELFRLNKDVLKGNPARLSKGMVLKLPE